MYFIQKPEPDVIQQFIESQQQQPFTYAEVGHSRNGPPVDYVVDHNRIRLGSGRAVFAQAQAALRRWEMFRLGWVALCWPESPLDEGTTVAVLGRAYGLWSLNACRIVYTLTEDGAVERFGFAYGTLPDHVARGEERFMVEWHRRDDSVWYDILAFSRPNQWLARLGYPFIRGLQRRFARDSMAIMQRVVSKSTHSARP